MRVQNNLAPTAPWHSASYSSPCIHICMCVFILTVVPVVAENRQNHRSPLAARLWQAFEKEEGREGTTEEGEGVDEVSKDSCITQLYLLQNTIWTVSPLHFNKSTEVKCLNSGENKTDVDLLNFVGLIDSLTLSVDGLCNVHPYASTYLPKTSALNALFHSIYYHNFIRAMLIPCLFSFIVLSG